jgi:hypothetical protein
MKTEKIHIGKIVEGAFNQSNLNKAEFSRAIGILPQNLNTRFESEDWSVIKLISAGKALNFDFSSLLTLENGEQKIIQKPKVILQIEVEDDKINDILKIVEDKKLYNILKR